jgi:hypothetical protein
MRSLFVQHAVFGQKTPKLQMVSYSPAQLCGLEKIKVLSGDCEAFKTH